MGVESEMIGTFFDYRPMLKEFQDMLDPILIGTGSVGGYVDGTWVEDVGITWLSANVVHMPLTSDRALSYGIQLEDSGDQQRLLEFLFVPEPLLATDDVTPIVITPQIDGRDGTKVVLNATDPNDPKTGTEYEVNREVQDLHEFGAVRVFTMQTTQKRGS